MFFFSILIRIYYDPFVEFCSNYIMCICYCVHMLHDDVCIVCKLLFLGAYLSSSLCAGLRPPGICNSYYHP